MLRLSEGSPYSFPDLISYKTPQFQVNSSFNNMMTQPAVCVIPSIMYNKEERLGYLPENVEPSLHDVINSNLTFLSGTSSK